MFEHYKRVEYVYISSVECVFENLFENQNESSIENKNKKKEKKIKPLVLLVIHQQELKGRPTWPGWEASLAPVGITNRPLVSGEKPGLNERPFSPGFVLPVGKPGLKGFPNRE